MSILSTAILSVRRLAKLVSLPPRLGAVIAFGIYKYSQQTATKYVSDESLVTRYGGYAGTAGCTKEKPIFRFDHKSFG